MPATITSFPNQTMYKFLKVLVILMIYEKGTLLHTYQKNMFIFQICRFNYLSQEMLKKWITSSVEPFVGPVGTASCCVLCETRQHSLTTTVNVHALTSLQGGLADDFTIPHISSEMQYYNSRLASA